MASSVYRLLAWAIENRTPIVCHYQGYFREICPIILGQKKNGQDSVLVWQTGGATSKGTLRKPDWKCFVVEDVANPRVSDGEWQAGSSHQQSQVCVKNVDYDANPASPYHPRRSLGNLRDAPLT
jgi:hypothetical protein